jgi:hypothetical protein
MSGTGPREGEVHSGRAVCAMIMAMGGCAGRAVDVENGVIASVTILASVLNLTLTKGRLKGAQTGHSLLAKKRDALTTRFRQILKLEHSSHESFSLEVRRGPDREGVDIAIANTMPNDAT